MEEIKKGSNFKVCWEVSSKDQTTEKNGFFSMLSWQKSAFERLHNAPFMILNAPRVAENRG